MSRDPRIDAYIAKAKPFARPILERFRELVHQAVPETDEAIKWGMPHFTYKDKNIAGMAAFKAHCAVIVHGEGRQDEKDGMGGYGKIASLAELPDVAELADKLRAACERIESSGSAAKPGRKPKPNLPVPQDFAAALRENPAAQATFDGFTDAQRRDYVEWITDAKRDETRAKRLATAIEWIAEGKRRNWKYESC